MSEPFIAEIKIFAGNFAPRGWAFCDGQLLQLAQNTALFSLIGTTYGGDGRTTVGLPNLQGRAPMHPGQGAGLSRRTLGQNGGVETVTLAAAQMSAHTHSPAGRSCVNGPANQSSPANNVPAEEPMALTAFYSDEEPDAQTAPAMSSAGGGQSHNNMQPFLAINFVIALVGVYPSRP